MTQTEARNTAHAQTVKAVLTAFDTTAQGLTKDEAARRLAHYGPNRMLQDPRRNVVLRFLAHFHNVLIYVLILAAVVTAALGHWVDTGVILAVIIVNAVIGHIQEGRAEQAMEAIRDMLAPARGCAARWRARHAGGRGAGARRHCAARSGRPRAG
jgi:magnesium-transporting ATPase (P-type)